MARDIDRRGAGEDRIIHALCEPPQSFVMGGVLAHVLTFCGAAARAVADQLTTGHILAIDRSATAIDHLKTGTREQIATSRLSARQVAVEDFTRADGEEPFDLVFAIRVSALVGRHPQTGQVALQRIAAATHPHTRLFIDGGHPLQELPIPRPA